MEKSKNLFGFTQKEADNKVNNTFIFGEIRKELEEYLLEQSVHTDSTDDVFGFLNTLTSRIQ